MSDEVKNDEKKYAKVTIGMDDVGEQPPMTVEAYVEAMKKSITPKETAQVDQSATSPKSRALFDSWQVKEGTSTAWVDKVATRLSDEQQRDTAILDPYVSAIVTTRVAQVTALAGRAASRFDKGVRIVEKKALKREDFEDDDAYEQAKERGEAEKDALLRFILSCGTKNQETLHAMYDGVDKTFMECSLKTYFQAQTQNLIVFGRYHRQSLIDANGEAIGFRPVPTETVKIANPEHRAWLSYRDNQERLLFEPDVKEYNAEDPDLRPIAYYQVIDGQPKSFFTEDLLKQFNYQTQAYVNLTGYPISPIENAIVSIFLHHNSLQQLRNMLVKGLLTKGMIALESISPDIEIPDATVKQFKNELQQFAMSTSNNAVVPVIAGPIKVNWLPMVANLKDSNWLEIEQSIIRALCASFQISPEECGFGALGNPGVGLGAQGKDVEIIQGEERGLRMIIDILQEDLNSFLEEHFPNAAKKYEVLIHGLGNETVDGMIQRAQAEMALTATMNDLLSMSEKNATLNYGGDIPLNQVWHQVVVPKMHFGKFLEEFMGEEGASKNPLYDFFIDPSIDDRVQARRTGALQAQAAGNQAQIAQAEAAVQQSQNPQPEQPEQGAEAEGQPEEVQKSLHEEWRERLHKSTREGMLSEWMRIHNSEITDEREDPKTPS